MQVDAARQPGKQSMGLELNHQEVSDPVRPAATVVLLRPAGAGMQVYMQKRHADSDVLAGAYVFPGGKVDREDGAAEALACLHCAAGLDGLSTRLGEPQLPADQAAAIYLAAIRETFEECNVLLAHQLSAQALRQAHAHLAEGMGVIELAQLLRLRLAVDALLPWSRWITPKVPSLTRKRFDTRFFVALLPEGQEPVFASGESESGDWLEPRAALDDYWRRRIELAPPQIMTLAHLARWREPAEVIAAARAAATVPLIEPHPIQLDGQRVVTYPGDPEHPVAARALPGPTRLIYRNQRFEPLTGPDEWFA
jgi:8-oxo-dGTP pyrophosphatase MutT (NUDIX family)